MRVQAWIEEIKATLTEVFAEVDAWFDQPAAVRSYRPVGNGWTINEILEHISLTSHFLLKLIDKGAAKALKNSHGVDFTQLHETFSIEREKLGEIGIHQSFAWIRPEHMEPTGRVSMEAVRTTIQQQKAQCLHYLDKLPNGEGMLYKTTMTVNNLGKLDVYAYIYFLAMHAKRHLTQMQKNEREWRSPTLSPDAAVVE